MDIKTVCMKEPIIHPSNKWKMKITSCASETDGNHSYRLSCFDVRVLDKLSWTGKKDGGIRKKSIDVVTELCGDTFIIYKAEDEMKVSCRPLSDDPEIIIEDDEKENLEIFRDCLITKIAGGHAKFTIKCKDKIMIKQLEKQYILPLLKLRIIKNYNIIEKNHQIELTLSDISLDFSMQIEKCQAYLIELLEYTSSILKRLYKNGKDLTEKTDGMDDDVDFSNSIIWHNVHLALLSKSYLVSLEDPYELASYTAYAKTIERAADNCVDIARLSNQLCILTQQHGIKAYLRQVFKELSKLVKEEQEAFEKAYNHFIGKESMDIKKFKDNYTNKSIDQLNQIFDYTKNSHKFKGLDPKLIAGIWRDFGQIMNKTHRLITYPYNIVLWKETVR